MRLFISYARVDKPYCEQIVKTLDIHEVWYDRRLHAGQAWWDEILRRLDWCDGFVYLLSPESVASEYCQKEFEVARAAGKHLFPVLIQARTTIPDDFKHIHYADLSDGLNHESTKVLLDAILVAERQSWSKSAPAVSDLPAQKTEAPQVETRLDLTQILADIEALMDAENFDQAAFLLKDLREKPKLPRVILTAITPLLKEAEEKLEWQAYVREAEREYRPLVALVKGKRTQAHGCEALQEFLAQFPDYDPENLAEICRQVISAKTPSVIEQPKIVTTSTAVIIKPSPKVIEVRDILPGPFKWCNISVGKVTLEDSSERAANITGSTYEVVAFQMTKYPITNAQYEIFVKAKDGYREIKWWDYSAEGQEWRKENPQPSTTSFKGTDFPRTHVTWYEAVAFCRWLSRCTDLNIMLPTEQQWQRAAQGDDRREYPWGNQKPNKDVCNFGENVGRTSSVTRYPKGESPFGVADMTGNVWEWCLNDYHKPENIDISHNVGRVVRGGSWRIVPSTDLRIVSRSSRAPNWLGPNQGFRVTYRL